MAARQPGKRAGNQAASLSCPCGRAGFGQDLESSGAAARTSELAAALGVSKACKFDWLRQTSPLFPDVPRKECAPLLRTATFVLYCTAYI